MYYFVMDSRNQLGHPTRRVDYIRKELTRGRARIIRNYSNVKLVQLLCKTFNPSETVNAKIILGLDPGWKHIGFAILKIFRGKYSILVRGVADIRSEEIKKLLKERKMYRQARRRHRRVNVKRKLGYRKFRHPRWRNRKGKKTLILKPTHRHLIDTHILLVRKLKRLINFDQINIEYFKYDSQKAMNPKIWGIQYQQGRMKGFEHVKAYVRHRDKYKCQICGAKHVMIHVHHYVPRKSGGSNRPDNLICLCVKCHDNVHKNRVTCPIPPGKNVKLRHSGNLNTSMPYIYQCIARDNPNAQIVRTIGADTKDFRYKYNASKSHDMDAVCIGLHGLVPHLDFIDLKGRDFIRFKQFRRHMRSWTSRIEDRKYYIYKNPASRRKTTLAWNRRKRSSQKNDSLQELRQKDLKIQVFVEPGKRVPKLSVKDIRDPKRTDGVIFRAGNQMLVNGRIETISGVGESQQRVYFEGDYYYTFAQLRKTGKHFRCNTGLVAL